MADSIQDKIMVTKQGESNLDGLNPQLKCYQKNLKLLAILDKIEDTIQDRLSCVRAKLASIEVSIRNPKIPYQEKNTEKNTTTRPDSNSFQVGIPYFRHSSIAFAPPPNEDTVRRNANLLPSWCRFNVNPWTEEDKYQLCEAIKKIEIERMVENYTLAQQVLRETSYGKELAVDISKSYFTKLEKMDLKDLIVGSKEDYNWHRVSLALKLRHSSLECESMWENYLHPKWNKGPWNSKEDYKLVRLAKIHNNQDWDTIARQLATNRSAYICFIQFKARITQLKLNKTPWTKEEDETLIQEIMQHKRRHHINWCQVASVLHTRTSNQIIQRWIYTLDPSIRHGKFSKSEDSAIKMGIRKFGKDVLSIKNECLPSRTTSQIRAHISTWKIKIRYGRWSSVDDSLLMDLARQYKGDKKIWKKIRCHMMNRTCQQLRHRHKTLVKSSHGVLRKRLITRNVKKTLGRPKKVYAEVDEDLMAYFKLICHQFGNKPETLFIPTKITEQACLLGNTLMVLDADISLPEESVIQSDADFSAIDKEVLIELKKWLPITKSQNQSLTEHLPLNSNSPSNPLVQCTIPSTSLVSFNVPSSSMLGFINIPPNLTLNDTIFDILSEKNMSQSALKALEASHELNFVKAEPERSAITPSSSSNSSINPISSANKTSSDTLNFSVCSINLASHCNSTLEFSNSRPSTSKSFNNLPTTSATFHTLPSIAINCLSQTTSTYKSVPPVANIAQFPSTTPSTSTALDEDSEFCFPPNMCNMVGLRSLLISCADFAKKETVPRMLKPKKRKRKNDITAAAKVAEIKFMSITKKLFQFPTILSTCVPVKNEDLVNAKEHIDEVELEVDLVEKNVEVDKVEKNPEEDNLHSEKIVEEVVKVPKRVGRPCKLKKKPKIEAELRKYVKSGKYKKKFVPPKQVLCLRGRTVGTSCEEENQGESTMEPMSTNV